MSNSQKRRAATRPFLILSSDDEAQKDSGSDVVFASPGASSAASSGAKISPEPTPRKRKAYAHDTKGAVGSIRSLNDVLMAKKPKAIVEASHSKSRHSPKPALSCRTTLLAWYDKVKDFRGMPWRKPYDVNWSPKLRTQRAYEVLVSEIMLQQTQIATVIPYYNRWMETFPTIKDLALADIEIVNARWKGLGYYSRAARLLAAAQKVVNELDEEFPSDATTMEKQLPGVGPYTAGAVCSIVFNEQTPAVDGNVVRLLSRVLALHANLKTAKEPLEVVWKAAAKLVKGASYPGDLNQALIELGSTVCKPTNPSCGTCPLQKGCAAYALAQGTLKVENPIDMEDICTLCEPFPDATTVVTRFPLKVEKKKAREASCAVSVISWKPSSDSIGENDDCEKWFLLVRRPETGLLAGLDEFPTLPVVSTDSATVSRAHDNNNARYLQDYSDTTPSENTSTKSHDVGSLLHVFSHIRMTYHIRSVSLSAPVRPSLMNSVEVPAILLEGGDGANEDKDEPQKKKRKTTVPSKVKTKMGPAANNSSVPQVRWVRESEIESQNISTGALKIWKKVHGIAR